MDRPRLRRYCESSVFIAMIQGEAGRADTVKLIMEAAERGETEVIISPIVQAEVIMLPNRVVPSSEEEEEKVRAYLRHSWIRILPITAREGELARRVAGAHGLKPLDALHVACALSAKATVLETYDRADLLRIANPPLVIREPTWEGGRPLANRGMTLDS